MKKHILLFLVLFACSAYAQKISIPADTIVESFHETTINNKQDVYRDIAVLNIGLSLKCFCVSFCMLGENHQPLLAFLFVFLANLYFFNKKAKMNNASF